MNLTNEDLKKFKGPVTDALIEYENFHGKSFQFGEFEEFVLTPEKFYTAKTKVPMIAGKYNNNIGDLIVVVFSPGDATGAESKNYNLGNVVLPVEFKKDDHPEKFIPRSKKGILYEGFFPLFSVNQTNNDISAFSACLEELTVSGNQLKHAWTLGQSKEDFESLLYHGVGCNPKITFTTGYDKNNNRVGDPHSIYNSEKSIDNIQVVGFLAIKRNDNPILKYSNLWHMPQ